MEKGQFERATRRALVIFDEWIRTTGVFHEHGSYRYEIEGIIEDAVHCGVQEAMGIYKKLESEGGDEAAQICQWCSDTGISPSPATGGDYCKCDKGRELASQIRIQR